MQNEIALKPERLSMARMKLNRKRRLIIVQSRREYLKTLSAQVAEKS